MMKNCCAIADEDELLLAGGAMLPERLRKASLCVAKEGARFIGEGANDRARLRRMILSTVAAPGAREHRKLSRQRNESAGTGMLGEGRWR